MFSTNNNEEEISLNKNIKPLYLPTEISTVELIEAEQKTEEKKEFILENQSSIKKRTNIIDKIMNRVWYTRPVSDEGDSSNEEKEVTDDDIEKDIIAPDINTSHSTNIDNKIKNDEDSKKIFKQKTEILPIPSWIHDQVYGDKVSVITFIENCLLPIILLKGIIFDPC